MRLRVCLTGEDKISMIVVTKKPHNDVWKEPTLVLSLHTMHQTEDSVDCIMCNNVSLYKAMRQSRHLVKIFT